MTMFRSLANEIDEIADLMPIIYEFYAVAAREQAIRKTIQKYFQSYTTLLEELIKVGIERGELRRVSPNEVALSLIALMEGCMLVWTLEAFDHHKPDLEKLFVSTMDLLLAGLKLEG
jgi:hypothetical protein